MVKKFEETDAKANPTPKGSTIKDSAQQIWLAGLGAFAKAQEEGSKVFEALVKEGLGMQRTSQAAAEEKIAEATSKMASMANGLTGLGGLGGITAKATGQWDKLENIFEDRVAKALKKLGVPSAQDIETLIARLEELNQSVQKLSSPTPPAKTSAPTKAARKTKPATDASHTAKPVVKRTAVRKTLAKPKSTAAS